MARIGVTGHRGLPGSVLERVRTGIKATLNTRAEDGPVEALSSLAAGADQVFADIALDCGVSLTAVIPGMDYEQHLGGEEVQASYRRLLELCSQKIRLPIERTNEDAYAAAGRWIVDHADELIAIWDGSPARGRGGTGEIVEYAQRSGVPVVVLWSSGVQRD
jgi:hypothetical protein